MACIDGLGSVAIGSFPSPAFRNKGAKFAAPVNRIGSRWPENHMRSPEFG